MESNNKACWPYLKLNDFKFPAIGLLIKGPFKKLQLNEGMIRIDTGYDGFLLLSEEKYKHLGFHLSELPQDIGLKERL